MESGNAPTNQPYERPTPTPRRRAERGPALIAALAIAGVLGIGVLVLSRYVAETRDASLILGAAWFATVGAGALVFARGRPELRSAVFASFAVTAVGVAAVGYWTGFRDTTVDEQVVVATQSASGSEREDALAGGGAPGGGGGEQEGRQTKPKPKPSGPVSIAKGGFVGVDGHDGSGKAEVVKDGNDRTLTFTGFDVDPGPQIEVYLTPDVGDVSDRIELGGLKGTKGDQQYSIPKSADLGRYDSIVLYCTPFTVRVAVAELS